MKKVEFIKPLEAVSKIESNKTLASGGFVGCAHPEILTKALEKRFLKEDNPKDLTLIYAAGQGDGKTRGMNHLAHERLIKKVIGGHWNLAPSLGKMALENKIEAYNFPQGVISHLFRDIAAGKPGTITHVGLETFIDPRNDGGRLNNVSNEKLVELVELDGKKWMFYKAFKIDYAFLRGTSSDSYGNISFEKEGIIGEAISIAQAVKNSGGKVFVEVEKICEDYSRDPKNIKIPGIYVDYVILSNEEDYCQTFSEKYNKTYTMQGDIKEIELPKMDKGSRRNISLRAFDEIKKGNIVNLGIGLPEGVAQIAKEKNKLDDMVLTVEAGPVGGVPAGGLSFGTSVYPHAIIDQPYMFDFYDGGGLDIAFLGMAECDQNGNVNVSKFSGRIAGVGGFVNITQNAKKVVFTGTFTAGGLQTEFVNNKLRIVQEGKYKKFVNNVQHVTFSGHYGFKKGQIVLYVTERAVFRLIENAIQLIEIAPGIDLENDIIKNMDFEPQISKDLKIMDPMLFN